MTSLKISSSALTLREKITESFLSPFGSQFHLQFSVRMDKRVVQRITVGYFVTDFGAKGFFQNGSVSYLGNLHQLLY